MVISPTACGSTCTTGVRFYIFLLNEDQHIKSKFLEVAIWVLLNISEPKMNNTFTIGKYGKEVLE